MIFSALTFNMQNGEPWTGDEGPAPEPDLAGTIAFLREHPTDFLFLQEVERGLDGGRQLEPPPHFTALQRAFPDLHAVFSYPPINPDELPFGLGLALFSKWPLRDFQRRILPAADIHFEFGGRVRRPSDRILISATAETPLGNITLLNTHLQAFFMIGACGEEHRGQRDLVARALAGLDSPALLAGDFNCAPEDQLVSQFGEVGFRPAQTREPTWRRRPYVLDHIFHNAPLRLLSAEVIPTPASDHHALRASFSLTD